MNKPITTRMTNLRDGLEAGCQTVADQARTAAASSARMVRREPHKALAVATLAGVAIGALLMRLR
jgi:ElaB/YqjD/DUF883 family membrane-anchored ribosome-binding protein